MQNTARDTQPVLWSDIEQAINCNSQRRACVDEISAVRGIDVKATPVTWMTPGWTYRDSDTRAHPLVAALLATDPLYEISAPNTRKGIEKEAAIELANEFDTLYAKHNGKGRGWIKTQMTSELNLWAGGATDIPFDWTNLAEKRKILSALIDIVCVKYCVRIAVWWSEHKRITVWPVVESDDHSWESAPLLNIEVLNSGEAHIFQLDEIRSRPTEWTRVFETIGEWRWIRPNTWPGIGSKSLADLKSEYSELTGKEESELPKRIDKETLANLIYKYTWTDVRLAKKEATFF
jgi:hypothetical protein